MSNAQPYGQLHNSQKRSKAAMFTVQLGHPQKHRQVLWFLVPVLVPPLSLPPALTGDGLTHLGMVPSCFILKGCFMDSKALPQKGPVQSISHPVKDVSMMLRSFDKFHAEGAGNACMRPMHQPMSRLFNIQQ